MKIYNKKYQNILKNQKKKISVKLNGKMKIVVRVTMYHIKFKFQIKIEEET